MPTKYIIEVYEPNSNDSILGRLESVTPFMAISAGDTINVATLDPSLPLSTQLEVTSVEHILYEVDSAARHKLMIFTKQKD